MKDRYNFDAEFDIERLNTHTYDDVLLSNKADEKITARREARKARIAKESDVNVITPEMIEQHKIKKKRKVHAGKILAGIGVLLLVVAFVGAAGLKLTKLQIEKRNAEKQLKALTEKTEQLANELQELDTDEYVENAARSELHMIKEGEVMYIVNPDLDKKDTTEQTAK